MSDRNQLTAPRWGDPFVSDEGAPEERAQAWIDEVSRILTEDVGALSALTVRVAALEPQYVTITSADSPYEAQDMDYILCDMSAGDVSVTVPSGRIWVSRDGSSNTLTLTGTISGTVNPTVLFDKTTMQIAEIDGVKRFV